jgi:hypothetical protein
MLNPVIPIIINVEGTLTADITKRYRFPFPVSLKYVSGFTSNNSDLHVSVGHGGSTTNVMTSTDFGDSISLNTKNRQHDTEIQETTVPAETTINIVIDFDGASGTAGQDLSLALYFTS